MQSDNNVRINNAKVDDIPYIFTLEEAFTRFVKIEFDDGETVENQKMKTKQTKDFFMIGAMTVINMIEQTQEKEEAMNLFTEMKLDCVKYFQMREQETSGQFHLKRRI